MDTQTTDGVQQTTSAAQPVSADAAKTATVTAQNATMQPTSTEIQSTDSTVSQDDLDIIASLATDLTATNPATKPDEGTLTRYQQDNARMRKAMIAAGIDPDSVDSAFPQTQPARTQSQATDIRSQLDQLLDKSRKNGVTQQDFGFLVETLKSTIDSLDRRDNATAEEKNIQRCISAIESVANTDPIFGKLPDTIRQIEHDMMIAGTDYSLLQDSRDRGIDPRQIMNPQNYAQFARKQQDAVKQWRNFWISVGEKRAAKGKEPNPSANAQTVQPLTNASGFTPAMPKPVNSFDPKNIAGSIRAYTAASRRTV